MSELDKWWQTMKTSWSNLMAYKLNFIFMVLGPSIVFLFIKYNIWAAIYKSNNGQSIQGYDFSQMIEYQVWVFVVAMVAQGFNGMDLATDIRLGRISSYLIYPFNFWQFHAAGFFAFQLIQVFIATASMATMYHFGLLQNFSWSFYVLGVAYCSLVGVFWFAAQFLIGIAAFWLDETWILRVMLLTVSGFLSGSTLPLEIFPDWLQGALFYSPFPYITYVPVKIFMGLYSGSIAEACAILIFWIIFLSSVTAFCWRRGLRLYTAAGM